MERLVIAGGTALNGEVTISGAKNAILPIMAACLLSERPLVIEGVPQLEDVRTMTMVLESLGVAVTWERDRMTIDPTRITSTEVSPYLMRKMRASNLVMGALIGRLGEVRVSYPGGCTIGSRPMDLHIKGFKELGAPTVERNGYIETHGARLKGCDLHLDFPSVGATENLMMAAVLAEGTTMIRNAAREPEIVDLQNFLNVLGARIKGAGLDTIRVDGVPRIGKEISYRVIPDRIETGTFMVAAAISRGKLVIRNTIAEHVEPITAKLRESGAMVAEEAGLIVVEGVEKWQAVDIRTLPYPGFPTDMQPQLMVYLSLADGTSVITENIFENRYQHVGELLRMGAEVRVEGRSAVIKGVSRLTGATVEATDLRAGAALVLGGLAAENTTCVEGISHLDRGYERIEEKLSSVGARIERQVKTGTDV